MQNFYINILKTFLSFAKQKEKTKAMAIDFFFLFQPIYFINLVL